MPKCSLADGHLRALVKYTSVVDGRTDAEVTEGSEDAESGNVNESGSAHSDGRLLTAS